MLRNCLRGWDQTLFFLQSVIVGGIFVQLSPISNVKFEPHWVALLSLGHGRNFVVESGGDDSRIFGRAMQK